MNLYGDDIFSDYLASPKNPDDTILDATKDCKDDEKVDEKTDKEPEAVKDTEKKDESVLDTTDDKADEPEKSDDDQVLDTTNEPANVAEVVEKMDQITQAIGAGSGGIDDEGFITDEIVLDAAEDDLGSKQERSSAMAIALAWMEGDDHTFDGFSGIAAGMLDIDTDEEDEEGEDGSEDEEEEFNDMLELAGEALIALGCPKEDVAKFIDHEDDSAAKEVAKCANDKLSSAESDDNEIISRFAVKSSQILDATVRMVKDGKIVRRKKQYKKRRMTGAQRAALKKARRKANSASAKRKRKKSMKVAKQRGMA